MKDAQGRGYWQRRRENAFEKSWKTVEERREEQRKAFKEKSGEKDRHVPLPAKLQEHITI